MLACALILVVLLPVALLPLTLEVFFSASELTEMGIRLGQSQAEGPVQTI